MQLFDVMHRSEQHMHRTFSEHDLITQLITEFNGGCDHFFHYGALQYSYSPLAAVKKPCAPTQVL